MLKLLKENDQYNFQISALRQELETTKREYEHQCSQMESQTMVGTLYCELLYELTLVIMFYLDWPDMKCTLNMGFSGMIDRKGEVGRTVEKRRGGYVQAIERKRSIQPRNFCVKERAGDN